MVIKCDDTILNLPTNAIWKIEFDREEGIVFCSDNIEKPIYTIEHWHRYKERLYDDGYISIDGHHPFEIMINKIYEAFATGESVFDFNTAETQIAVDIKGMF